MRVIREMTAEAPDLKCRGGLGSNLSGLAVLRQSARNVPLLLRHIMAVAAFPPRQLPRVFKTARAAAIGQADAASDIMVLVDEGVMHFICSMSVPGREEPPDFRAVAELVARSVAGIVVVETPPELALIRASQRDEPASRFSSGTPRAVLERLYRDFERTLSALLDEVERLAVPVLRVNGALDARTNAERIIMWTRELHGRQVHQRPVEDRAPAAFQMTGSPQPERSFN
jgi:hypothetical protein